MAKDVRTEFPPLDQETRDRIDTRTAAYHLSRKPKTLRAWASGAAPAPIDPVRINGRLAWPVARIRELLQGRS